MRRPQRLRRALPAALLLGAACLPGCGRGEVSADAQAAGPITFAGTTAAGEPVVLVLRDRGDTATGVGTWNGEPVVVSGTTSRAVAGMLVGGSGVPEPVRLELSADGRSLELRRAGELLLLDSGAAAEVPPGAPGPFAGDYEVVSDGVVWADVSLGQHASLLLGTARVAGVPAALSGRVTAPDRAEGTLVFADESRRPFVATLSSDGRTLAMPALGPALELQRRAP